MFFQSRQPEFITLLDNLQMFLFFRQMRITVIYTPTLSSLFIIWLNNYQTASLFYKKEIIFVWTETISITSSQQLAENIKRM